MPEQSLAVVLGNANAVEIVVPQGELRLRIPRSSGLAKRVELIVRRQCRRRGRSLYRCLRSRHGNQGEYNEGRNRGSGPKAHGNLLHLPVAWQAEGQMTIDCRYQRAECAQCCIDSRPKADALLETYGERIISCEPHAG